MFVLNPKTETTSLLSKHFQNLLKISLFGFLVLLVISFFTNNFQVTVWANNQSNSSTCGDNLVQLIAFCQKDLETGNFIFGYNNFEQCNQNCIAKKEKENWDNLTYAYCALACENTTSRPNLKEDKRFRASGYNQCVDQLLESNRITRNEMLCACNNNERFLQTAPVRCLDFIERPKTNNQTSSVLLNLLPECFYLDLYAPNIIACARSIVNILLVIGIILLGVSLGYLAAQSLISGKGSFWLIVKERIRDLIVGILLIGTPVAILSLIDPRSQFLDFANFVELSLGKNLKDPTGKVNETCDGDPGSTGVVYHYTFEADKLCGEWGTPCDYNIKYPTLAFHNCKVFVAASRYGGHLIGSFPIFDVKNIQINFDIVSRGRGKIDYEGPRVAAGENKVGIINVAQFGKDEWGFETRFWDTESETYSDQIYTVFTDDDFLFVARVAYYKGDWIAIAPIEKEYKVANLGPDLNNRGNRPIQWKTFESDEVTYRGHAELITNQDFTELYAIFGARGDNSQIITIMKYDDSEKIFKKFAEINTSNTQVGVCYRPSGALDSEGKLHFICDDVGGGLYYYTNKTGAWVQKKLTNKGVAGVIRIDQKDGIHVGYMVYQAPGGPAYMYSADGGENWTDPIIANEIVNPKYGFSANMIGGVAIQGQNPYLLVTFEDWTNGSPRVGFIMFGAEA